MTAIVLLATVATAAAVLWPERSRARRIERNVSRFGPVRLRDGRRASKAAQAAASADGCVWCDEMPCQAGPHWSWTSWAAGDINEGYR